MKQFKISAIVVGLAVLFIVALTFVLGPNNADTDALERQALVAEGKSITAEMEQANHNHDWSRVTEIRKRDAAFKRRAGDYLARHGQTPLP